MMMCLITWESFYLEETWHTNLENIHMTSRENDMPYVLK